MASITSDKNVACVGCDITFTVTTTPSGHANLVTWSGGGNPSSQSGGATFTTKWTTPGTKTVTVSCGTNSKQKTVTVVEVDQVTEDANATQTNVTGTKNWAAVKESGENVIVKAVLNPSIPNEYVSSVLSWSGGIAVSGQPLKRKVSKGTSAKTTVTATVGSSSDYVDIWILWADVEIKMTGTTPANAAQFGTLFDGTENLGAILYDSGSAASGKIVAIGTISPTGVHNVVTSGWNIYRRTMSRQFKDGIKSSPWDTDWEDDTSHYDWLRLTPDSSDQIYDTDGPNIKQIDGATDSVETYNNFLQWIMWNDEPASDFTDWYWKGWWKDGESPEITLKDVGSGNIDLPDENEAYYDPP